MNVTVPCCVLSLMDMIRHFDHIVDCVGVIGLHKIAYVYIRLKRLTFHGLPFGKSLSIFDDSSWILL